jgi:hypothetical protein
MKYFRNQDSGEVFGYDETDPTQIPYMEERVAAENLIDITESWPLPPPSNIKPSPPTVLELQAQLATLAAQIQELTNKP